MASDACPGRYNNMKTTSIDFINGFVEAHKAQDTGKLSSYLTPTCRRYLAPASFLQKAPQLSAGWSNAEYESHMQRELEGYSSVEADVKGVVVDMYERKATVQSLSRCVVAADHRTWEFEFVFILTFSQDGLRIEEIVEYVDTAVAEQFIMAYSMKEAQD